MDTVIELLKAQNIKDICCIKVAPEINYADYMIIGTCASNRHLNSSFISINQSYKGMKEEQGRFMRRQSGKETKWCAIDTGKIVIHLFLDDIREQYDLESLWTCGSECDEKALEFAQQQANIERLLVVQDEPTITKTS